MDRSQAKKLRSRGKPASVALANLARKMITTAMSGLEWALKGFEDDDGNVERASAPVYQGGSLYRAASGVADALVLLLGGESGNPVVVAVRDEAVAKAVIAALNPPDGTHVLFGPSGSVVYFKDDETVEVRTKDGTAVQLATKNDLDVLRAALTSAAIALGAGGAAAVVTACDAAVSPSTWPVGTSVLKGE